MSYLVIAYPEMSHSDYEWIESLRSRYDKEMFEQVRPHVTLVFPVTAVCFDEMAEHVRGIISETPAFPFASRAAVVHKAPDDDSWFLFLVADEGNSRFIKLHDRLYTGALADELRHDLPYTAHMTIGRFQSKELCMQAAAELNRHDFKLGGFVNCVDIISLEGTTDVALETIRLADSV